MISTECTGSCKSNYHMITTTMALVVVVFWGLFAFIYKLNFSFFKMWRIKFELHFYYGYSDPCPFTLLLPCKIKLLSPFGFMVYNATFINIAAISWQSVLLVKKTGVSREKHRTVASHRQALSHNVVSPEWDFN